MAATSVASIAATASNTELFTGGAFDNRVAAAPSSRVVPPSEIDIDLLTGELLTDSSGNSNQMVLRVDPLSPSLRTDLLRSVPASQLDTQSGLERAVIDAVRGQKDRSVLAALGEPTSARYVIVAGRDTDAARLQAEGTLRLLRKYNAARDDHAIFPEPLLSQYQNEGYTLNSGSDWLGYVYENTNGYVPAIQ